MLSILSYMYMHYVALLLFLFLLVIVIHWTRQIKELINSQESLESAETSGPLQEIEFWRARSEDLSGNNTHTHTHTGSVLLDC